MAQETLLCSHCGREIPFDDVVWMDDDPLCYSCSEEETVLCDHCGQRIYWDDNCGDSDHILCESCFEQYYTRCENCGAVIHTSDVHYVSQNDEMLCADCYNNRNRDVAIHEYSYKPKPVFHGTKPRYFGVELEIDEGGQDDDHADTLLSIANASAENLYIKTDGSLDNGMELVTHPMTLNYHMCVMPWAKILHTARSMGYYSHQTDTCGLHIHISRLAFGNSYQEQELSIARLLFFIEKFWPELLRFSRRTERQLNRWATRYGVRLNPKEQLAHAKNLNAGRYTAVNLTNRQTIEIRIFRGTLKANTLLATLQMVNHICDVAVSMSDNEVQEMGWYDFLNGITEPELIQYLKERQLYVNEPIETEVDF